MGRSQRAVPTRSKLLIDRCAWIVIATNLRSAASVWVEPFGYAPTRQIARISATAPGASRRDPTSNAISFPATCSTLSEAKRFRIGRRLPRPEHEPNLPTLVRLKPSSCDNSVHSLSRTERVSWESLLPTRSPRNHRIMMLSVWYSSGERRRGSPISTRGSKSWAWKVRRGDLSSNPIAERMKNVRLLAELTPYCRGAMLTRLAAVRSASVMDLPGVALAASGPQPDASLHSTETAMRHCGPDKHLV